MTYPVTTIGDLAKDGWKDAVAHAHKPGAWSYEMDETPHPWDGGAWFGQHGGYVEGMGDPGDPTSDACCGAMQIGDLVDDLNPFSPNFLPAQAVRGAEQAVDAGVQAYDSGAGVFGSAEAAAQSLAHSAASAAASALPGGGPGVVPRPRGGGAQQPHVRPPKPDNTMTYVMLGLGAAAVAGVAWFLTK